jgi:hypothetical protein
MKLSKEELMEWHNNPVTQAIKEYFIRERLPDISDLQSTITKSDCCEHIALRVTKQAGITEGIWEVLNYGK